MTLPVMDRPGAEELATFEGVYVDAERVDDVLDRPEADLVRK